MTPAPADRPAFLDAARACALVTAQDAVRLVAETFVADGSGRVATSVPPALGLPLTAGAAKIKAAARDGVGGVRIAVDPGTELVSHCVLFDGASGRIVAVVDETVLHRLRTAASAAVVLDLLRAAGRPVAVALVGTGRIADEIPAVLGCAGAVTALHLAARSYRSAQDFVARHESTAGMPLQAHPDVADATAAADVVILLTSAQEPVFDATMLRPGMTVLGLGGGAEIASDVLAHTDRFFVDDLHFALGTGSIAGWLRSGLDAAAVRERLTGSIGDLAAGTIPGRTAPQQTVLAIVQGLAACDVSLAAYAWERHTTR